MTRAARNLISSLENLGFIRRPWWKRLFIGDPDKGYGLKLIRTYNFDIQSGNHMTIKICQPPKIVIKQTNKIK